MKLLIGNASSRHWKDTAQDLVCVEYWRLSRPTKKVVQRQNGFHRLAFPDTPGTMQGGLLSLTLFNVVVENVIRTWFSMTVEDHKVDHDRMGEAAARCQDYFTKMMV